MQNSTAKNLNPEQRKNIAINVVANYQTITAAANENNVSRKFVVQQRDKALQGISNNFKEQDNNIVFYVPVTKSWLQQMVLLTA